MSKTVWRTSFLMLLAITTFLVMSCAKSGTDESNSGSAPPWVPPNPFPHLASAVGYAVLGGTTVSNTGSSVVYGDIGVSPGTAISGMTTIRMTGGSVHPGDSTAHSAHGDALVAYNNLLGAPCSVDLTGQDLGGMTLRPGTYCFSSSATLTGVLKLDSGGSSTADFVFQIQGSLTAANGSSIQMINGGATCNAYWQVSGPVLLGAATNFIGSILSLSDITLGSGTKVNGKVISNNGSVTMDTSEIYDNTCPE